MGIEKTVGARVSGPASLSVIADTLNQITFLETGLCKTGRLLFRSLRLGAVRCCGLKKRGNANNSRV